MKVTLQNLTKTFPSRSKKQPADVVAVNDFTFEIPDGVLLGLLGPSGCGKSTTLNLLSGLQKPTSGRIFFGDDDVTDLPAENRGVGLVFQNYALYPHLTVRQNITFPLENRTGKDKLTRQQMADMALEAAKLVQIEELMDRKPKELSGGQQQRVAIARALVKMPKILLLDEPLSNLDARLRLQTREEIRRIQKATGITTVFVTHDQEEAMSISDLIVVMKDGVVQQIGTPQEVFDHPANLFVAGFIGTPQMNLFDAQLVKNNGKYAVSIDGVTVELSDEKQQRLSAKDVPEQDVVLGVRPDHIMLCADGVKGKVDVSELMGSSVHLHITAGDKDVVVIVPTNGNAAHFPMGSEVNMIFGGNVAHVFSKETEKNLEW